MNRAAIEQRLRHALPDLLAVYAFGSRVSGDAGADSDLDLAVLIPGKVPAEQLWQLAHELADDAGCAVDLLDFRAASTVLQYRILMTGERWWASEPARVDAYEAGVLNDKLDLDIARAPLLADIVREGRVYGG